MKPRDFRRLKAHLDRDRRRQRGMQIAIAYAQRPRHWTVPYARGAIAAQFDVSIDTVKRAVRDYGSVAAAYATILAEVPTPEQARAVTRRLKHMGATFDGLFDFWTPFGYELVGELSPRELVERAAAAGIIRKVSKTSSR